MIWLYSALSSRCNRSRDNPCPSATTDNIFTRPSALATLVTTLFFLGWPIFFLDLAAFSIDFVGGFFLD